MPWGIQRLNVKKSQPNSNIIFIKPLKGPDEKIAQDFLERIAAQCLPVMRQNHLYVMSLEEFPANREFVGRNFNAGEVIQLVLKSPQSGRWLPFEYVQMVMMHELAHCKQMNHSRAFWAVRNAYADEIRSLWGKGYTGEGIWGRGAMLGTGRWERNTVQEGELLPEHLCGGTFRSRGRKRKKKPTLSYQERKERRIRKKFGKNGVALGSDEETKVKLEKGKRVQAKPRVAGSARGRELRAAAALARFEQQKEEKPVIKDEDETESGSESDYDDGDADLDTKDAIDVDGSRLVDEKGRGMVKVCEDETGDDPGARDEMAELEGVFRRTGIKRESPDLSVSDVSTSVPARRVKDEPAETPSILESIPLAPSRRPGRSQENVSGDITRDGQPNSTDSTSSERRRRFGIKEQVSTASQRQLEPKDSALSEQRTRDDSQEKVPGDATSQTQTTRSKGSISSETQPRTRGDSQEDTLSCSMCSFINPGIAVTCNMCANVLDPAATPDSWRCLGAPCKDSTYRNSGDCGVCGLCGQKRPAQV